MTMRSAASRLVTLATLAALAASIVGTTAADARSPGQAADRSIRIGQDPGRSSPASGRTATSTWRNCRHRPARRRPLKTGPRRAGAPVPHQGADRRHRRDRADRSRPRTPTRRSPRRRRFAGLGFACRGRPPPASRPTRGSPPGRSTWFRSSTRRSASTTARATRTQDRRHVRLLRSRDVLQPGPGRLLRPACDLRQPPPALGRDRGELRLLHRRDDGRRHRLHRHRDLGRPDPTLGWGVLSIGYTDALPGLPGHRHLDRQGRRERQRLRPRCHWPPGMGCEPDGSLRSSAPRWT